MAFQVWTVVCLLAVACVCVRARPADEAEGPADSTRNARNANGLEEQEIKPAVIIPLAPLILEAANKGDRYANRSAAGEWGYFHTEPVAAHHQHLLYTQPVFRAPQRTQLLIPASNADVYRNLFTIFHGQQVSPVQFPFPFYSSYATKHLAHSTLSPYPYKQSLSGLPLRQAHFDNGHPTFDQGPTSAKTNVVDITAHGNIFRKPYAKEPLEHLPKKAVVPVEKSKNPVDKGFSVTELSESPGGEGRTNGSLVMWRPPGSEKLPVTLLVLQPQAKAVSGINGTSIATPVSRAVVPQGHPVDIHFNPRAVAIAGPGGSARAHSDLFLSIVTTKSADTHT